LINCAASCDLIQEPKGLACPTDKRCFCLSVVYIVNNSRTQRPSMPKFRCDLHTSFKVKMSGSPGTLMLSDIVRHIFHWLPVHERVIFKHALLVFKALHGLLPPYLADDCQLLADAGRRQLRSSDVATCSVLRTHSSLRDRCFAVAGRRTWNSLPIKLRQPDLSLEQFRRLLKTHLFS